MRNIRKMDDAVVGIIATFLITGLIVIVISLIQTVYIPKWMEQTEAEHMEVVAGQFSQLKFAIDTQSRLEPEATPMPISTSITLGNKEMPFLISSRAYGSLEILSNECEITFTDNAGIDYPYQLGIIKYSSVNSYFLNQDYIYEAGALILSQSEGNTMSVRPALSVKKEGFKIQISLTLIDIEPIGGKNSISGYGTYPIQTEYSEYHEIEYANITDFDNIEINTNYPNSWVKFIKNTFTNAGLTEDDFAIETIDNKISVRIKGFPGAVTTIAKLKVIEIGAQIAPGWIENVNVR